MAAGIVVVRGNATHPTNPIKQVATNRYELLLPDPLIMAILVAGLVRARQSTG